VVSALRLYQLASGKAVIDAQDLSNWKATLYGDKHLISENNEQGTKDILLEMCYNIIHRARAAILKLGAENLSVTDGSVMAKNVQLLWREEEIVAEQLAACICSGQDVF
jgi:hypothetical protein